MKFCQLTVNSIEFANAGIWLKGAPSLRPLFSFQSFCILFLLISQIISSKCQMNKGNEVEACEIAHRFGPGERTRHKLTSRHEDIQHIHTSQQRLILASEKWNCVVYSFHQYLSTEVVVVPPPCVILPLLTTGDEN